MLGYEAPAQDVAAKKDSVAARAKHMDAEKFAAARALFDSGGIGFNEQDDHVPRPGRAADYFGQQDERDPWKGPYTHISLNPGTPQTSDGDRPETQ